MKREIKRKIMIPLTVMSTNILPFYVISATINNITREEWIQNKKVEFTQIINSKTKLTGAQKKYLINDYIVKQFQNYIDENIDTEESRQTFEDSINQAISGYINKQNELESYYKELKNISELDELVDQNKKRNFVFASKEKRQNTFDLLQEYSGYADYANDDERNNNTEYLGLENPDPNYSEAKLLQDSRDKIIAQRANVNNDGLQYLKTLRDNNLNNSIPLLNIENTNYLVLVRKLFYAKRDEIVANFNNNKSNNYTNPEDSNKTYERNELELFTSKLVEGATKLSNLYDSLVTLVNFIDDNNLIDLPFYKYATNKNTFDEKLVDAKQLISKIQNNKYGVFDDYDSFSNEVNNGQLENALEALSSTFTELDGNKAKAKEWIRDYKNLTPEQKNTFVEQIDQITDKNFPIDSNNSYRNLNNNNLEANNQKIKVIMQSAIAQAKENFSEKIDSQNDLIQQQKDYFINKIDSNIINEEEIFYKDTKLDFDLVGDFEHIEELNDQMHELKTYYDSLENSIKDLSNTKYVDATPTKRDEFKKQLLIVKQYLGIISDEEKQDPLYVSVNENDLVSPNQVTVVKTAFEAAFNALDGQANQLEYLSDELKNQIQKELANSTDDTKFNRIKTDAQRLNEKVKDIYDKILEVKKTNNYTSATAKTKDRFDTKITYIKSLISSDNWDSDESTPKLLPTNPEPTNYSNFTSNKLSEITNISNDLDTLANDLDGLEVERINSLSANYSYDSDKTNLLPSEAIADDDFVHEIVSSRNLRTDEIITRAIEKIPNDETGVVTIKYQIVSSTHEWVVKEATTTVDGFLSRPQKEFITRKNQIDTQINDLSDNNKITENQKAKLAEQLQNYTYPTNNIDDLNNFANLVNQIADANVVLDGLVNLTATQIQQLKDRLVEIDSNQINEFVETAKTLDNRVGMAKEQIENANLIQNANIYLKDLEEHKIQFDTCLTNLDELINNDILTRDFSNANLDNLIEINDLINPTKENTLAYLLTQAINQLDGNNKELSDRLDNFKYLNDSDKESLRIQLLTKNNKYPSLDEQKQFLNDAFEQARSNAIDIIEALNYLSEREKVEIKENLVTALINVADDQINPKNNNETREVENYDKNLDQIVLDAQAKNQVKKDSISNNSSDYAYLNKSQIDYYNSLITSSSDITQIETIIDESNALDSSMSELHDYVTNIIENYKKIDIHKDWNYLDADENLKVEFDKYYDLAKTTLDYWNGTNLDKDEVDQLYEQVKSAFEALNGNVKRATKLSELQDLVNESKEIVKTNQYLYNTQANKDRYLNDVNDGKTILANSNEFSLVQIQEQIDKIKLDKVQISQNGDYFKQLIDKMQYLSTQEKDNFKNSIDEQKDFDKTQDIFTQAQKNNQSKKEYVDLINSLKWLNQFDKDYFNNEVKNSDTTNKQKHETIKNNAISADKLVEKLLKNVESNNLSDEQIDELINQLNNTTLNDVDYQNLANQFQWINSFNNLLEQYLNSKIDDSNYLELKAQLEQFINHENKYQFLYSNTKATRATLEKQIQKIKVRAVNEILLTDSLINNNFNQYNKAINDLQSSIPRHYLEFDYQLTKTHFFRIIIQNKITSKDVEIINTIKQKDLSNVQFSAFSKIRNSLIALNDSFSWVWWLFLGLSTFSLFWIIFAIIKRRRKNTEQTDK